MTNFADRTIWTADNLYILRGLTSASVGLIYLDPPFNRNYAALAAKRTIGAVDVQVAQSTTSVLLPKQPNMSPRSRTKVPSVRL